MTHRLTTNYAKNYCNRTLIVKVIVENVVRCFFGTRCKFRVAKQSRTSGLFQMKGAEFAFRLSVQQQRDRARHDAMPASQ